MIYADFESTLAKTNDPQKLAEHIPNSVGLAFVCTFDPSRNYYKQFVGDDCVINFMLELKCIAEDCIKDEEQRANGHGGSRLEGLQESEVLPYLSEGL